MHEKSCPDEIVDTPETTSIKSINKKAIIFFKLFLSNQRSGVVNIHYYSYFYCHFMKQQSLIQCLTSY